MNPAMMIADGAVRIRVEAVLVGPPGVREIVVRALGPFDDDMRVRVRGITVFDTRYNVAWYSGEVGVPGGANFNPSWQTLGFRVARVSEADLDAIGGAYAGDTVEVDVFDGWGGSWLSSPWVAMVTWSDGRVTTHTGGVSRTGTSDGPGDTFVGADHFAGYQDAGTYFGRYTIYDWDTCILGGYSGNYEAGYNVDGHITYEASGGGMCTIIESTGSYATYPGFALGTSVAISSVDRMSGVIVSNLRRNADIYNAYCGNADGSKIWGELSVPIPSYYATGPHFSTYIPNGAFVL